MTIVLIACAMRMFAYANLPGPIWVLPVEFISGFTFSMCYVLTASYSSLITIPGTESTVLGLFGALFDGLGAYTPQKPLPPLDVDNVELFICMKILE